MSTETELGFIVPVDADAPNGPLQIGGNATKANELLQKGGVSAHVFVEEASRASATLGSFTTPLAVELPKVKAGQIIDLYFTSYVLKGAGVTKLGLQVAGSLVAPEQEVNNSGGLVDLLGLSPTSTGGLLGSLFAIASQSTEVEAKLATSLYNSLYAVLPFTGKPIRVPANAGPVKLEIVGKAASGTMKIFGGVLAAHVRC